MEFFAFVGVLVVAAQVRYWFNNYLIARKARKSIQQEQSKLDA